MLADQLGEQGFRWWMGIVEAIDDPLKLGRVKVRIINEHDDNIKTDDIDWAFIMLPVTSATVEGVGDSPNLSVGTQVMGVFIDGNEKQIPMVLGTRPIIPDNDENKHSISWLARGKNTITKDKIGPEPESPYKAEYPYNRTITSRSGHVIELDDTPEHERVHIYHKSGTYFEINEKGRLVIKTPDESIEIVKSDKTFYCANGNWNNTVKKGDWNVTLDKGNVVLTVTDGTVTIDCDTVNMTGDLNVDGNIVAQGEVTGNGVNLSTHTHSGVREGDHNTGIPN